MCNQLIKLKTFYLVGCYHERPSKPHLNTRRPSIIRSAVWHHPHSSYSHLRLRQLLSLLVHPCYGVGHPVDLATTTTEGTKE